MLQPELKQRRDKIRVLMAQQSVDAAIISCNTNLIYTFGRVVSGYLYLPLHDVAHVFVKRPNDLEGEHIHSLRKPEQLPQLIKELGLPMPTRLMLEGDELPFNEYNRLAACFPDADVVPCGTALIRQARSVKTEVEISMFRRSASAHAEVSAGFEIEGSRRNEIFRRQAAVDQAVIAKVEWLPGIRIKRIMHDL